MAEEKIINTNEEVNSLVSNAMKALQEFATFPSFVNYLVKFWRINYKIINQY